MRKQIREPRRGERSRVRGRKTRDRRDEGGGGEEQADGELLGKAMVAGGGVDEDEVASDEGSEEEKELQCGWIELRDEHGEGKGGDAKSEEERSAVAMMEEMTQLKIPGGGGVAMQGLGVKQAVGGVEGPDHQEHGNKADGGKVDAASSSDERGPKGRNRGGIEREKVPEMEDTGKGGMDVQRARGVGVRTLLKGQ